MKVMTQRLSTWRLPKTFDNFCIDAGAAADYENHCCIQKTLFQELLDKNDLEGASKVWTSICEETLAAAARDSNGNEVYPQKSYFGRAKGPVITTMDPSPPTVRDGRDSDFNPGWGQCSLRMRQMCRQARRLTNLIHLLQARLRSPTPANEASCNSLWNSICHAPGFSKNFPLWYVEYAHESFPLAMPEIDQIRRISEVFQGYCDAISHEHVQKQRDKTNEFFSDDWNKGGAKTFAQVKEEPLPSLPFVVDTITSKVKKVRWQKTGSQTLLVDDPQKFGLGDNVTFQGQQATIVDINQNTIRLDTVLYLRNQDHTLKLKKYIYQPEQANQSVGDAWNKFFQKDMHTPLDSWGGVEDFLPHLTQESVVELPALEVEVWKRVHAGISKKSARGPCGYSVFEMLNLPEWVLLMLFQVFNAIHGGQPWPRASG